MSEFAQINPLLRLLSDEQLRMAFKNGTDTLRHSWFGLPEVNRMPVALLRCQCPAYYLITEIDPTDPNIVYCLYDDAEMVPSFDTVDFEAMFESAEGFDHPYECVSGFVPTMTIEAYLHQAKKAGSVAALFAQLL